ncbi:GNAT family N-acetyltransferase [Streptomyces sp. DT2A-34]|uniref:GNAT family N-acetyltransferase n=1 Tax=Streptomyces sp. DT2A-34 TaxID=3051182 RepID=UPI00265BAB0B|nr:GNAT family N-acetyltransferase [Streptomyces sp. DT2A-34]MDO0915972.1 GNAT family N-acetyltransferase [Streptomyces sp. DT2A-34]
MSETFTVVTAATGRRYVVREAGPGDEPGIQALFEASTEYFEAATGLPPGPADVQSLYYSLPPGADPQDKRILVVAEEAPGGAGPSDACSVGLFLLRPSLWGTSLGPALAARLLEHAADCGVRRVTATVPAGWERGRRFLSGLSFTVTGSAGQRARTANRRTGPREPAVDQAELILTGA